MSWIGDLCSFPHMLFPSHVGIFTQSGWTVDDALSRPEKDHDRGSQPRPGPGPPSGRSAIQRAARLWIRAANGWTLRGKILFPTHIEGSGVPIAMRDGVPVALRVGRGRNRAGCGCVRDPASFRSRTTSGGPKLETVVSRSCRSRERRTHHATNGQPKNYMCSHRTPAMGRCYRPLHFIEFYLR